MGEVTVSVPSFLASLFQGQKEVRVSAATLQEAIDTLAERFGERVRERLLDSGGRLKPALNIYVNGKNVTFTGGLDTSLSSDDKVSILPAVAGG